MVTVTAINGSSGIAPHLVGFELCPDRTWSQQRDRSYLWYFDDSGSDHNSAVGYKTAHVFETPGTYTVTVVEYDNADNSILDMGSVEITVTDPDSEPAFATTNTLCVSTSGTFTGAPTGAATLTTSDPLHTTIASALQAGQRVLFRYGESWAVSGLYAPVLGDCSGAYIGAFGTPGTLDDRGIADNAPDIDLDARDFNEPFAVFAGSGIKITDVEFNETASNGALGIQLSDGSGTPEDFVMARTRFVNVGACLQLPDAAPAFERVAMVNCRCDTPNTTAYYGSANWLALIGNFIDNADAHPVRITQWNDCVIRGNRIEDYASGQHGFKMHANGTTASLTSNRCYISRNTVISLTSGAAMISIAPQNPSSAEDCNDVWVSSNQFISESSGTAVGCDNCVNVEIVNNYAVFRNVEYVYAYGAVNIRSATAQNPENARVIGNSLYSSYPAASGYSECWLAYSSGDSAAAVVVHSNVVRSPATDVRYGGGSAPSNFDFSANWDDDGTISDPPGFVSITSGSEDLQLSGSAAARSSANTGTRLAIDALGNFRPTSNWDPGAFEESPVSPPGGTSVTQNSPGIVQVVGSSNTVDASVPAPQDIQQDSPAIVQVIGSLNTVDAAASPSGVHVIQGSPGVVEVRGSQNTVNPSTPTTTRRVSNPSMIGSMGCRR